MQLGHTVKADGRWRLFAFCPDQDPAQPDSDIHELCRFLEQSPDSPLATLGRPRDDFDATIDLRAVFQQPCRKLAVQQLPGLLLPRKGSLDLIDYEKAFCADHTPGKDIFTVRGINRSDGCIVIVRPDQYVANMLPLKEHRRLAVFFGEILVQPTEL